MSALRRLAAVSAAAARVLLVLAPSSSDAGLLFGHDRISIRGD